MSADSALQSKVPAHGTVQDRSFIFPKSEVLSCFKLFD